MLDSMFRATLCDDLVGRDADYDHPSIKPTNELARSRLIKRVIAKYINRN